MDEQELTMALGDPEYPPHLLCADCGSIIGGDSTWRWNGKSWEHRCTDVSPYLGHYMPNLVKPSELVRALRIAQSELRAERERVKALEAVREAAQNYMEHIGELNKNMAHRHPCIVNDHEELTWGCWINQKLRAALSAADGQQGQS